jgi:phosphatidylethanolamine/phosphatidyl-N-methylethanolamine N-methyltransferase
MIERVRKEKRFWDRFAPRYDRFMSRFAGVYAQLVDRIQLELDPSDRVLEIATGTGLIALEISKYVSSVTAIDISEPMIRVARSKARSANIGNVDFHVQDACALSFDDEEFDVCLVVNALHVMLQPELALREIRRVLKPSGRLIAPTYCHGENRKSRLVSRIMGLFGFKAYSRFSIQSYSDALTADGFHITDSHVFAGTPPLACLTAEKRSL